MTSTLNAKKRTETGSKKVAKLRAEGELPGVVYGAGSESEPIILDSKEFEKIWRIAGESTMLTLAGLGETRSVLIQDVEVDKLLSTPIHVDLLAVKADEVVEVSVPLTFTGVAPAEKDLGGSLVKVMHEITIEALPKDLPHEITVDLTTLKTFDDQIHVEQLQLPSGVTVLTSPTDTVALVQPPQAEEEEPEAPVDLSEVEVEKKGKTEEEESTED